MKHITQRGYMDTMSDSEAKNKLQELIREVVNNRQQFQIVSKDGTVVMLPKETYDNILVTLELLSTPGLLDQLKLQEVEEEFSKIEELSY